MRNDDSPIAGIFRLPFANQIAAFRLRLGNLVPTARWDDIAGVEHDRAFTVAGAVKADLLADLAAAVDKAINDGTTLEEFRRDFRNIVEKHGWHGWTGEGTAKGEAWRTRVIYQTNMRTTYMAGRLAQLREGNFKFWVYFHGNAREPRLQHLAWDGIVLPPDHPFWATHYPPNGWGCTCYASGARSEAGAKRLGGDPGKVLPDGWQARDARTGAPTGISRGWDHAPGSTVSDTITSLRDKLNTLPPKPSIDLIQSWLRATAFEDWFAKPTGNFPLVRIPDAEAARIGSARSVADLSPETLVKQKREHPELSIWEYAEAQTAVSHATEVIRDTATSLVFIQEVEGTNGYVLVVRATHSGQGLFVSSYRRLSGDPEERRRFMERVRRRSID